jgi:hypothetical protein
MSDFLTEYLAVLQQHGSLTPQAIKPLQDETALDALRALPNVTLPDELRDYFRRIDGYDVSAYRQLGTFEPQFAWGMFCLTVKQSVEDAALCEEGNGDYWPKGFVPILLDGSGCYLLVNCIASSPTYRGVYDLTEGVGANRVSDSLAEFFRASAAEIRTGLRRYDKGSSSMAVGGKEYLERAAPIFGHTPYFSRIGRMGTQIVDWK